MSLRRWVDELGSWLGYELISRKGNAHIFAEKTEEQGNNSYSKHQQKISRKYQVILHLPVDDMNWYTYEF